MITLPIFLYRSCQVSKIVKNEKTALCRETHLGRNPRLGLSVKCLVSGREIMLWYRSSYLDIVTNRR